MSSKGERSSSLGESMMTSRGEKSSSLGESMMISRGERIYIHKICDASARGQDFSLFWDPQNLLKSSWVFLSRFWELRKWFVKALESLESFQFGYLSNFTHLFCFTTSLLSWVSISSIVFEIVYTFAIFRFFASFWDFCESKQAVIEWPSFHHVIAN